MLAGGLDARQHTRHGDDGMRRSVSTPAGILATVPYEVSTPVFEGPFDLLLHLISREQVDIYQVSLSAIVDAYVAQLEQLRTLDLEVATEFLLIAAVLLELKARRLLPGRDDVDLDEELGLWEERDLLLARLFECKTFKDAAAALARHMDTAGRSWPRTAGLEERFFAVAPDFLAGVTPERLRQAYLDATAPKPAPRVDLDHVAPVRVSVADAVAELLDELPRVGRITFRRLTQDLAERLEVIVRFLAVLELYKQGLVDLEQATSFGDLHIAWLGADGDDAVAGRRFPRRGVRGLMASEAQRAIEAILMVAEEPIEPHLLAQILEVSPARVEELCAGLAEAYAAEDRGFVLVRVAGGYRFQSHPDLAPYVERFVLEGQSGRLSAAALETLAIVAYKQPVSRAQVAVHPGRQRGRRHAHPAAAGLRRRGGPRPGPGPGAAVRHDPAVPGEARPRPRRPAAAAGRLRARARGDGGARAGPPPPRRGRRPWGKRADPGGEAAVRGARRPGAVTAADVSRGGVRLQKVLAQAGIGSRRACEELIAAGRVTVDGEVAELGRRVDVDADRVAVDGVPLSVRPGLVYYLLNKPAGVVTTAVRPRRAGRPWSAWCPAEPRVFPVGRLDAATEGLLLLTNDGDLAQHLTHPRYGVDKEYLAVVRGTPTPGDVRRLREGVDLDDGPTAPARVAAAAPPTSCASPSTRAATARSGACATPSATRSSGWSGPASARWPTAGWRPAMAAADPGRGPGPGDGGRGRVRRRLADHLAVAPSGTAGRRTSGRPRAQTPMTSSDDPLMALPWTRGSKALKVASMKCFMGTTEPILARVDPLPDREEDPGDGDQREEEDVDHAPAPRRRWGSPWSWPGRGCRRSPRPRPGRGSAPASGGGKRDAVEDDAHGGDQGGQDDAHDHRVADHPAQVGPRRQRGAPHPLQDALSRL